MKVLVAGLVNLETSAPVEGFPLDYAPARYPTGIHTAVSGVGGNVALALAALGTPVRLLAPVGDDPAGRLVRDTLSGHRLEVVLVTTQRTPQAVVLHDPGGRRAIFTDTAAAETPRIADGIIRRCLDGCDLAVLCNVDWTRPLLGAAREAGVPIATDLHAITGLDNPYDTDYLDSAAICFLSGERIPDTPERFATRVLERSPAGVVGIGLAERGALVAPRGGEPVLVPAPTPALRPVLATTGGGDALLAGFVHFHRAGLSAPEAMRRAVVFASWKVGAQAGSEGFLAEARVETLLDRA